MTAFGYTFMVAVIFILILLVTWLVAGILAAALSVRDIRRLEPGVKRGEGIGVMFGWGLGTLAGASVTWITALLLLQVLGQTGWLS